MHLISKANSKNPPGDGLKGEFQEKDYLSIKACCTIEYQPQIFTNCEKYANTITQ
jgi:hypothetical protein